MANAEKPVPYLHYECRRGHALGKWGYGGTHCYCGAEFACIYECSEWKNWPYGYGVPGPPCGKGCGAMEVTP